MDEKIIDELRAQVAGFDSQLKDLEAKRAEQSAAGKAALDEVIAAIRAENAALKAEIDTFKAARPASKAEKGILDLIWPFGSEGE